MDTGFDLREHGGVDVFLRDCPTRAVLELIASKWTMLVLVALEDGRPMRFAELRRRLDGVTPKVLTSTLRALEREGLLTRSVYPTVPPRVEYRLTGLGREVGGLLQSITDWSQANITAIQSARHDFDERAARTAEDAVDPVRPTEERFTRPG
ncbi:helix-turn-helix domain-containing protein [Streptomyces sp. Root369]|uniref:winged helix-turn-helix transcriptional regulator n=1 Tax=Streptomyces sp. Root369 TaxID=1736523 RepID=UPI000710838A|nr:helix-turn-helix domain-containing protein [Streptomyces sp. Root369]KQW16760.1 HxlR family transcriptional regulator [Streptomyces sp. Root369]